LSQSTIIFVVLLFLFLVFITVKGQLPTYFKIFSGGNASSSANSQTSSVSGGIAGPLALSSTALTGADLLANLSVIGGELA
jgi:hypothetical protein